MRDLIDQALQFITGFDQAPILFQQWCTGWVVGACIPMRTLFRGDKEIC